MELHHLRYFLAVAEERHFGRAAQRLNMTQPPLSQRIADLENELGVLLFVRSSKGVSLTEQGESLLPHARKAVSAFDVANAMAPRMMPAKTRKLTVRVPPDTSGAAVAEVGRLLRHAGFAPELGEATTADQHAMLLDGKLDLALLRHPYPARGLWSSLVLRQPLGVLMSMSHSLAIKPKLRMSDLRGQPLVLFHRSMAPGLYDEILRTCRAWGYVPPHIQHAMRIVKGLLIADSAICFHPGRVTQQYHTLVWRPLVNEPLEWRTSAVCRRRNLDGALRHAAQILIDVLQTHDNWSQCKVLPKVSVP
ncbi:MAG: LysR family transcriptional regulator [Candidatus Korobacteraceae bacterium]